MTFSTFQPVIDAIESVISPTSLISILAGAVGVAIVFVLMWWGVRTVSKIIMRAVKRGKLSV